MSDEQESAQRFPITIIDETENDQDNSKSSQSVAKDHRASEECSSTKTELATSHLEASDIHQTSIDKRSSFSDIKLQRENKIEIDLPTKHSYFVKSSPDETKELADRNTLMETEGWHTEYDSLEAGQTEESSEIEIIPEARAETKRTPWKQHEVYRSLILEKYVEVTNVPTNSTFESLEECLGLESPNFQQSPNLVYCEGETTALLICYNREDAERFLFRSCGNMTFKRCHPKVLTNVMYSVDENFWKELKQHDTLYESFKVEMQNAGVSVLEQDRTSLLSPTMYQNLYAVQQIKSYSNRCRASGYLENIEQINNVSERIWQFVSRSSWIKKLQTNNISIRYVDSSIMVQGTLIDNLLLNSFRDFVSSLQKREIDEFMCTKAQTEDVHKWCSEMNISQGYECCCYIEERQTVLVLCMFYEEFLKIRHFWRLKSGEIKSCKRRTRPLVDTDVLHESESMSPDFARKKLGDEENIFTINVSNPVWQFVKRSSWKTKLEENNISISYENSLITVVGTSSENKLVTAFNEYVSLLANREMTEVNVENAQTDDVHKWSSEINNTMGYECCCFNEERKTVLIMCKTYEDVIGLRLKLMVLTGAIKSTGRNIRPVIGVVSKSGSSSTHFAGRQSLGSGCGHSDFDWDVETHVEHYETKQGIKVYVYKANILKLPVECIVNVTNDSLNHRDGIARDIADAAGYKMLEEDRKYLKINGKLTVGSVCSSSPGNLPYACVIHTVGPAWTDYAPYTYKDVQKAEHDLYSSIYNSFYEAERHELASIAIPLVIVDEHFSYCSQNLNICFRIEKLSYV